MQKILKENYLILLLAVIFSAGALMRPPLPVDETRYLTVAWEMWFQHDWIHLSVNFEPYHHKPPLLFWLINIFWHIFGISRFVATLPSIFSAVAVVFLTQKLATKLFPNEDHIRQRTQLLLLGSLPFLIYGSLIMFDMMIAVSVLAALLFLINYAEKRSPAAILGYGLCMGVGVLTKGPVIYVYTLLPALLGPLWIKGRPQAEAKKIFSWVLGWALAIPISAVPVLLWLVPTLQTNDSHFAYWLLWEQTAGRVTGGFSNAHGRPFYFYLPIVPALLLPWILFPAFWQGLRARWDEARTNPGMRFLALWMVPGFVVFSLISGKQPHYLVPFLPGLIIMTAFFMRGISIQFLQKTVLAGFALFVIGNAVAMKVFFPLYDWRPLAAYIQTHQGAPLAYVRNYNGEIGFMARLEHSLTSTNLKHLPEWFAQHPDGLAIIRYKSPKEVKNYELLFVIPYRGNHYAGVFRLKKPP